MHPFTSTKDGLIDGFRGLLKRFSKRFFASQNASSAKRKWLFRGKNAARFSDYLAAHFSAEDAIQREKMRAINQPLPRPGIVFIQGHKPQTAQIVAPNSNGTALVHLAVRPMLPATRRLAFFLLEMNPHDGMSQRRMREMIAPARMQRATDASTAVSFDLAFYPAPFATQTRVAAMPTRMPNVAGAGHCPANLPPLWLDGLRVSHFFRLCGFFCWLFLARGEQVFFRFLARADFGNLLINFR